MKRFCDMLPLSFRLVHFVSGYQRRESLGTAQTFGSNGLCISESRNEFCQVCARCYHVLVKQM